MQVNKLIIQQAENYSQKAAIIFADQEISFTELKNSSFQLANYLVNKGLRKEQVAIFLPKKFFGYCATYYPD